MLRVYRIYGHTIQDAAARIYYGVTLHIHPAILTDRHLPPHSDKPRLGHSLTYGTGRVVGTT